MNNKIIRPKLLFREKIENILSEILNVKLIFVSAPMGYGKTTVVKEYIHNKKDNSDVVYFQIVDKDDNEKWIWNQIIIQISKVNKEFSEKIGEVGFPDNKLKIQKLIDIIEADLKKETILIIDDWHNLNENSSIISFINSLCLGEKMKLHIIAISRKYPDDIYVELESKQKCIIIDEKTIKFTLKETKDFFNANECRIDDEKLNKIYKYTGGWTAATYLSLLEYIEDNSLTDIPKAERLVKTAIYNKFNDTDKKILLKLSLLDNFSIEQAYYITKEKESIKLIKQLNKDNCFIRYDSKSKLYTIHTILKEVLLKELYESDINRNEVYDLCGQWYEKKSDIILAIKNYYTAQEYNKALESMKTGNIYDYLYNIPIVVVSVFEKLTLEEKLSNLELYLAYINCYTSYIDFNNGVNLIEDAEKYIVNKNDISDRDKKIAEIYFAKGVLEFNNMYKMAEYYEKVYKLFNGDKCEFLSSNLCFTLGASVFIDMYFIKSGDLKHLVEAFQKPLAMFNEMLDNCGAGIDYIAYGEYYFYTGNLKNAEVYAKKAMFKSEGFNKITAYICSLFLLIRINIQLNNKEEIYYYRKKFEDNYKKFKKLYFNEYETSIAYIYAITGNIEKINQRIFIENINPGNASCAGRDYMLYIIRGINLAYKENYIELEVYVEQMRGKNKIKTSIMLIIYSYIFEAVSKYHLYGITEGEKSIMKAINLAAKDNIVMPFAELAPYIMCILKKIKKTNTFTNKVFLYVEKYYFIYEGIISRQKNKGLTKREKEIMKYIAKGYTQAEIAQTLNISVPTVKKHSSSVYSKLGVKNKTMALKILRERNTI